MLNDNCRIPVLFCGDFEHGIGCQISGFTKLPDLMALGATHRPELAYEYGRIIAEEGRTFNLRWAFGPVSDLNTNHINPVTNVRSIGDNPGHAAGMLKELVRGMQEHGMAACPKHFPGDGTDTRNQHIVTSLNLLGRSEWKKMHGGVFKALIDAGAASIMAGRIGFPAYEPIDKKKKKFCPATASKKIMTGLLRGELGFKGIILTDALCMNGFISWGDYEERLLASFSGGTDVFLWPETERFFKLMKTALEDGRASMGRLEESVRRVMSFKAWLGLDRKTPEKYELTPAARKSNNAVSAKIAEASITLLRNHSGNIPLKPSSGAEILMLALPETEQAMKPLQCFKGEFENRGFKVTLLPFSEYHKLKDAEKYELVFMICNCRPLYIQYAAYNNYSLWHFMKDPKIRKRIIMSFGAPYFLYETAEADAYLNVYSDSENSQRAAAKALFGEIPFAGRSPVAMKHCFGFGEG